MKAQPVILKEVKDLALFLTRSFAVLTMISRYQDKTHTPAAA